MKLHNVPEAGRHIVLLAVFISLRQAISGPIKVQQGRNIIRNSSFHSSLFSSQNISIQDYSGIEDKNASSKLNNT